MAHPYEAVMKCQPEQRRWKCAIRIHKLTHNISCRLLKLFGAETIIAQIVIIVFVQLVSWNIPIPSICDELQPQAAAMDD